MGHRRNDEGISQDMASECFDIAVYIVEIEIGQIFIPDLSLLSVKVR